MSNLKISQLPNFTGNTSGSWLIANNSGQTETFKIQRESFLSGYQPSGNYATTGSNTFIGNQTITGSINVSGSVVLGPTITGLEGINFMSASVIGAYISYNPTNGGRTGILSMDTNGIFGRVNIGSSGSSGSLLLLNKTGGGITTLIGSSSISLQGNNIDVTGSVNISEVMTLAKQNPLPTGTTGSLAVSGSGLYFHNGTSWNLIS
jgi:hypothetical protein